MKHSVAPAVIFSVRLQRVARLLTVGFLAGLAFLAAQHGSTPPAAPERTVASDRSMAEAWSLAERAQSLLEAHRPAAALAGFQRAYALSSDPSLLLEVARLENEIGSRARAAHAFEVFLERGVERSPQQRQLARRQLAALTAHTARVNMQTNVQGAEVELEAERGVARTNGFVVSLLLDVGERRISLSKPGYETQTVAISVEPGEVRTVRVDLEKAARGRSQAAPARPRWARLDLDDTASESGRGLVEDVRAAL
jgi:hypothetical protein